DKDLGISTKLIVRTINKPQDTALSGGTTSRTGQRISTHETVVTTSNQVTVGANISRGSRSSLNLKHQVRVVRYQRVVSHARISGHNSGVQVSPVSQHVRATAQTHHHATDSVTGRSQLHTRVAVSAGSTSALDGIADSNGRAVVRRNAINVTLTGIRNPEDAYGRKTSRAIGISHYRLRL